MDAQNAQKQRPDDVLVHRAEIPNRNYFKSIVLKEPSKPETVKILRIVSRT